VEAGHPVARTQHRRERVCFLLAGSAVKAGTPSSAETHTGRTGHEQVRGQKLHSVIMVKTNKQTKKIIISVFY